MIQLYKGTDDTQIVMGTNGSTPLWVAEDGSWGTTPVTIFDAHNWTSTQFDELDNAPDSDKVEVAKRISDKVSKSRSIEVDFFLDLVRERSAQLGLRIFELTDEGMNELV